jgi:hypothetical protein
MAAREAGFGDFLEGGDEVTVAHACVMRLLPEDHAECRAGLEPGRGDGKDPVVARDEDQPSLAA